MASELRLARKITQILEHSKSDTFTLGHLLSRLGVQGQIIFIILLVTPMLQPVPLPGISTVLSFLAVIVGFQLLFRLPPWLPKRYEEKEIQREKLEKWLLGGLRLIEKVERYGAPRRRWFGDSEVIRQTAILFTLFSAVLLALPLPIPLSNFFPASAIFTFGLGLLEDDGLYFFFGFLLFMVSFFYIAMIFVVPWYLTQY